MSITSGAITCRSYVVAVPPKKNFISEIDVDLKRHAFKPVKVDVSPRSLGWVNARNILDTDLNSAKVVYEDFLVLGLRVDKVAVNAKLYKAYFNQAVGKLLRERHKEQLGREERSALAEKVKLELMAQTSPSTALYEMAWNLTTHRVYFSATSNSLNQELCDLFSDTFHTALTPLFPYVRADLKAEKEGLAEPLLQCQPARFSPVATVREYIQEDE